MSVPYKQDAPPKGGYGPIDYKRHLPRRGVSGYMMFIGCAATMTVGFIGLCLNNRRRRRWKFEDQEAKITLMPILMAEEDRRLLIEMKKLREQEAEIMKDVPGWVPGEKIYHSDRWVWPSESDMYNLLPNRERVKKIHEYYLYV
ncbi:NADH dehydrogenase [ubiquinone] 1 alpha subcomplex subunit 13-like [Ptychodera flava]|uniref:NADH dehydrogenase [ubiquinone] 1 alpha subcomplex subunit 13-like n=1 Tax=Ptychodera flava TaxID=63121 RepID=UPI003969E672